MFFNKQLTEYHSVNKIFARPFVKFWFGKWRHSPFLPISKTNYLYFGKYGTYTLKWSWAKITEMKWNDDFRERHPIYTRLFKPVYSFPAWLVFRIDSYGLGWKTKYDDYRFEWNPAWIITLFGMSFAIYWCSPSRNTKSSDKYIIDNDYWEAILNSAYNVLWDKNTRTVRQKNIPDDFFDKLGKYSGGFWIQRYGEADETANRVLRKEFFKKKWHNAFANYCLAHPYKKDYYEQIN